MALSSMALVLAAIAAAGLVPVQHQQQPPPEPPDLSALIAGAKLEARPSAWCRGEFRRGRPGAYAVAVPSPSGGGRYLVLEPGGAVTELGTYAEGFELSCYAPREAENLDAIIRNSETIEGRITPRWRTTVVCGFTDDTTAACWQYSPQNRAFVKVGGWVT
jgi:hypothetical protein